MNQLAASRVGANNRTQAVLANTMSCSRTRLSDSHIACIQSLVRGRVARRPSPWR